MIFYELCDKYGIMVIQEWPTAWNSHKYATVRYVTGDGSEEYETYPKPPFFGLCGAPVTNQINLSGRPIDMMGRLSLELDGSRRFTEERHGAAAIIITIAGGTMLI